MGRLCSLEWTLIAIVLSSTAEAAEWRAPTRFQGLSNPIASTRPSIDAGRGTWIKECRDCHGDSGRGDGPGAARLERPIPDLREPTIAAQSDGAMFFKVKTGRRPMPGYRDMLSDESIWNVVNYMRQLVGRGSARAVAKRAPVETPPVTPEPIAEAVEAPVAPIEVAHLDPPATSTRAEEKVERPPQPATPPPPAADGQGDELAASIEDLRQTIANVEGALHPGTLKLLISGTAASLWTYTVPPSGSDEATNTFNASLAPHFFFKIGDHLLSEAHVDIKLTPTSSEVNLEFAHIAYVFNQWLILGFGKIVTPFGLFQDRIHTSWINRLPTEPFIVRDPGGIIPKHDIGVTLRGVLDLVVADLDEVTSIDYAFYLSNGPQLVVPGAGDNAHVGELMYDSYVDNNKNKAVGGRIGWRIVPPLEIGGSGQWSRVGPSATPYSGAYATMLGADLHFAQAVDWLAGFVLIEAEYARVSVTGTDWGLAQFDNLRQGMYALLAYSPSTLDVPVLRNFEVVGRFDYLKQPAGAPQLTSRGFTVGLNYWFASTVALKAAYARTRVDDGGPPTHQVLTQLAAGF
jgi:mono/diheme cytochrome c family protein